MPPTTARDSGTWKRSTAFAAIPSRLTACGHRPARRFGFARYFSDEVRPARAVVVHTVGDGLFAWDGAWYADIASHGYGALSRDALRFFPGFPLLGRLVGIVAGDRVALVVIANVAALVAAMLLYRLVRWERGDAALATRCRLVPGRWRRLRSYVRDGLQMALRRAVRDRDVPRRAPTELVVGGGRAAAVVGVTRPTGVLDRAPDPDRVSGEGSRRTPARARSAFAVARSSRPCLGGVGLPDVGRRDPR